MSAGLAGRIVEQIRRQGPMSVAAFMAMALHDPQAGYYARRDPLGRTGDFITAPEISQVFGELIGVWCAELWQRIGAPEPVILAELGPGRGTLMADLLRATAPLPAFHRALRLYLVEASPVLRAEQQRRLAAAEPLFINDIAQLPPGPLLLIANEFLDALPIRQLLRGPSEWAERMVGLDALGRFVFVLGPESPALTLLVPPRLRDEPIGTIVEICPAAAAFAAFLGERFTQSPGAALFVDYGHSPSAPGSTLSAVRRHEPVDVLEDPGNADLSAHVDFAAFADAARSAGAVVSGPVMQGRFLAALGAEARLQRLSARAGAEQRALLQSGVRRLIDPDEMGTLFKAMAVTSPGLPAPAGFCSGSGSRQHVTAQSTITLAALDGDPAIRHAFFTRQGGVSRGLFASLNCGFGSGDDLAVVARNREIAASHLGLAPERLVTCHQVHGTDIVTVERPWRREDNPHADGTVTKVPGIALGVLAADCAPVLFADPEAGVIGAAHGGWRGTLAGVMEAAVKAMIALGARPERIRAGIGPCIAQASYEVGPEFRGNFTASDPKSIKFFVPATRPGHFLFDLPGYIALRLQRLGLAAVERTSHDTAAEEDLFFSYRRTCLRGERDYGRGLAAITLTG